MARHTASCYFAENALHANTGNVLVINLKIDITRLMQVAPYRI